ncbi:hypothetical protein REPUB_Repub13aG0178600 [Reevesia pubescens]
MEGRRVALMACLVLGVLIGQSTATFGSCYFSCFVFCVITPQTTPFLCSLKCLKDCIIPSSTNWGSLNDIQSFCKLGCATTLCSNISSKENPGEDKVGSCVDSCSETCAKKN